MSTETKISNNSISNNSNSCIATNSNVCDFISNNEITDNKISNTTTVTLNNNSKESQSSRPIVVIQNIEIIKNKV